MNFQNHVNGLAQGVQQPAQRDNVKVVIVQRLSQQQKPGVGWQAQMRPDDRINAIYQL